MNVPPLKSLAASGKGLAEERDCSTTGWDGVNGRDRQP